MEDDITFNNMMATGDRLRQSGNEVDALPLYVGAAALPGLSPEAISTALHMRGVCERVLGMLGDSENSLRRAYDLTDVRFDKARIMRDSAITSLKAGKTSMAMMEAMQSYRDLWNIAYAGEVDSQCRREVLDEAYASLSFAGEIEWAQGNTTMARRTLRRACDGLGHKAANKHYYLNAAMRLFKYSPVHRYLAWSKWWRAMRIAAFKERNMRRAIELVVVLFGLKAYDAAETWYRARRQ